MTKRSCEIKVVSRQTFGTERELSEETYAGRYADAGEKKYLSYKRKTEDGDVDCLLSYEKGRIIMTQKGAVASRLEFIPGKRTENKYTTSLGSMAIPIFTRGLSIHDKKTSVEIMIDYDIVSSDPIQTKMEIIAEIK